MKDVIEKLLEEVDRDIKEVMMKDSKIESYPTEGDKRFYKNWEMIEHPVSTILEWQFLRNNK